MPRIDAPTVAEHHAQRRAALVSAAVDLLAHEGPTAVQPAGVAAGAGLARSSVYQYFPSTGALLGAAVEEMFRRALADVEDPTAAAGSAHDRVTAYVDAGLDAALAGHLPLPSYAGLALPGECQARVVALHVALMAPLVSALEDAGVDDATGVAGLVNGALGAGAAQIARGEDPATVRTRVRAFVAAAVTGLAGMAALAGVPGAAHADEGTRS